MPTRVSDEKKLYICEMLEKGCTYKQISQDLGVSNQVIANIKREFYGDDSMKKSIVAGDKFNGLLTASGMNQFVGTCRVGAKFEKKRFNANNSREAKKLWEAWKEEILSQGKATIKNPPIEVTRVPKAIPAKTATRKEVIKMSNPKPQETADHIYILAVGTPKLANWFADEKQAKDAMAAANKALEFAGVDIRYSVIEVARQGVSRLKFYTDFSERMGLSERKELV